MWPLPASRYGANVCAGCLRSSKNGKPVSYRQGFGAGFGKDAQGTKRSRLKTQLHNIIK
jgi:hypothetical protein